VRVLRLPAGNLYGGVESLLVTLARERHLCPEMQPSFALCFEGRLGAELAASGVAWVSRHGETGLTVPVEDAPALAAAARRLLEEPGLRGRLAAGGQARAAAEFHHRVMAERSLAYYSNMELGEAIRWS
jgi:hypothetical protein